MTKNFLLNPLIACVAVVTVFSRSAFAEVGPPAPNSATVSDVHLVFDSAVGGSDDQAPPQPAKNVDANGDKIASIFVGAGLMLSYNDSKNRVESLNFIEKPDGSVYAQVKKTQNASIGFVAETHYGFYDRFWSRKPNESSPMNGPNIGNVILCGPWTFANIDNAQCGPQIVANISSEGSNIVSQFGIGWALTLPDKSNPEKKDFTIGVGVLIDPDTQVVDSQIVDQKTWLVRPEFKNGILDKSIDPLVSRSSVSAYFMVSKLF